MRWGCCYQLRDRFGKLFLHKIGEGGVLNEGNLGLLLGAGSSCELGMPLVWELTAEIKRWLTVDKVQELNDQWRTQGGGYPDGVIADLVAMLNRTDVHYEAILGHLEAQLRRKTESAQHYHGLYQWLVELVYHLLYYRQVKNDEFLKHNLHFFDGLRQVVNANHQMWIFSLNHDVLIEMLAARLSIPIHTGFGTSIKNLPRRNQDGEVIGEIKGAIISKDELEKGAMYYPNPPQPGINLFKLHGSLDVFAFNNGDDLLKLIPDGFAPDDILNVLRAANEDLFFQLPGAGQLPVKVTNEIAYADDQGEMQFLRRTLLAGAFKFDAHRQQVLPLNLLRHFEQNLNFVSKLVCIGYGFADQHVNIVVRKWLEFATDRQIVIVNPSLNEVPPFLLHLCDQVSFARMAASDWLDAQAGIDRTDEELLGKRLAASMRPLDPAKRKMVMNTVFAQYRQD